MDGWGFTHESQLRETVTNLFNTHLGEFPPHYRPSDFLEHLRLNGYILNGIRKGKQEGLRIKTIPGEKKTLSTEQAWRLVDGWKFSGQDMLSIVAQNIADRNKTTWWSDLLNEGFRHGWIKVGGWTAGADWWKGYHVELPEDQNTRGPENQITSE